MLNILSHSVMVAVLETVFFGNLWRLKTVILSWNIIIFVYLLCPVNSRATIIFIIFWNFMIFYQIFVSPQVKQCAIITDKHGIYEVPHDLPNDLRLNISGKTLQNDTLVCSFPVKIKILLILAKSSSKIEVKFFL